MKSLMISTAAALMLTGAAFAQTAPAPTPPAQTPAPPSIAPKPNDPNKPMDAARPVDAAKPMDATKPTMARADGWLGTQVWKQGVYDPQNARIGEVDDLVINTSGQITHALIGVGGFLGIGEKTVAVPFSSLKPMSRDGRIWFELSQSKEQLNAAPAFDLAAYKRS
jgi:hypothetical protein